jgi:hypothetical protein
MELTMHILVLLISCVAISPALAYAGRLADIEVYDRTDRRTLAMHEHEGRLYVVGEPQHQYELRIRSRATGRLLAVTSVDGVNVITGETAAEQQSGYVISGGDSVTVEGWRKSLDDVATFYFTRLENSYAARTGRPYDLGVIGVALFREREHCCTQHLDEERAPYARHSDGQSDSRSDATGAAAAPRSESQARRESKLGTGHGHRESSPARYVDFERAAQTPDEILVIYYDSRRNLAAQGVLPQGPQLAQRRPTPFPAAFVPDP